MVRVGVRSEVTRHTISRVSRRSNNRDHGMQPWRVSGSFWPTDKVLKILLARTYGVIGNIFISERHEHSPKMQDGTVRLIMKFIISDLFQKTRFQIIDRWNTGKIQYNETYLPDVLIKFPLRAALFQ